MDGQNAGQVTSGQRDADLLVIHLGPGRVLRCVLPPRVPRLVTLARALSGSREHAEDLAQDVMVVVLRRWDQISRLDNPTAYARRTCANLAVSPDGRRWAEMRALVRLGGPPEPLPCDGRGGAVLGRRTRLPKREAQVVALFYGCDLPVAEIADILGIAEETVKAHLSHARDRPRSTDPGGPSSQTEDEGSP